MEATGFVVQPQVTSSWLRDDKSSTLAFKHFKEQQQKNSLNSLGVRHRRWSPLRMAIPGNDENDPFRLLGLDEPTSDKKVIKRAYKRMALKYHPDVSTTKDSTPEEKKAASDRFAKINWAYEVLSGKRQNDNTYGQTSTSTSSSSAGAGWTPPHRRSGTSSSGSPSSSSYDSGFDWTDFMPKDYSEEYDAGGDSFGQIFSDLFVGAAAGAAGMSSGNSIFKDFIEFLEGNVDGLGGPEDDSDLRMLLQTGSLDDVANEMDDTELVVTQLQSKLTGINDEIMMATAEASRASTRYMEKIELEESLAELNARKEVVKGYVKQAQKRLLALQTRYKELITNGADDPYARGQSQSSSWDDIRREAKNSGGSTRGSQEPSSGSSYSQSSSSSTSSSYSSSPSGSSNQASSGQTRSAQNDEDSWMNESFGGSSYGRGRGGSRRRSARRSRGSSEQRQQRRQTEPSSRPTSSYSAPSPAPSPPPPSQRSSGSSARTSSTSSGSSSSNLRPTSSSSSDPYVPPHRRGRGSYESKQEADKKRMRELKVDEEFENLKKELGL